MKRGRLFLRYLALATALLPSSVSAQSAIPQYVRAQPDAIRAAFGADVAGRIFSDRYTAIREDMIAKSVKRIPAHDCGAKPLMALAWVVPFPVKQGAVSWIERFVVDCKPRAQRNFLAIMEGDAPRMIELLPGASITDPVLQRDAFAGSSGAAVGARPKDCDRQWVIDTRVTAAPRGGGPWTERWSYDLCGTRADVEMTFTPSARSGTSWSAKLLK